MFNRLANYLIRRAMRTPYLHLKRPDGSLYMGRYWLVPYVGDDYEHGEYPALPFWGHPIAWLLQRFKIAVRVHHINAPDADRHLHDHPWSFVSVVLQGWYVERRPIDGPPSFEGDRERCASTFRKQGSIALRKRTDRHQISDVPEGGVWTLFITGPWRQKWGFYTPTGWVPHEHYPSEHQLIVEEATP